MPGWAGLVPVLAKDEVVAVMEARQQQKQTNRIRVRCPSTFSNDAASWRQYFTIDCNWLVLSNVFIYFLFLTLTIYFGWWSQMNWIIFRGGLKPPTGKKGMHIVLMKAMDHPHFRFIFRGAKDGEEAGFWMIWMVLDPDLQNWRVSIPLKNWRVKVGIFSCNLPVKALARTKGAGLLLTSCVFGKFRSKWRCQVSQGRLLSSKLETHCLWPIWKQTIQQRWWSGRKKAEEQWTEVGVSYD